MASTPSSTTDSESAVITRPAALLLLAAFATALAVPAWLDQRAGVLTEALSRQPFSLATTADDRYVSGVENYLRDHSSLMRRTRPTWNALQLRALRHTSGFVIPGRDDWLFSLWSLRPMPEGLDAPSRQRMLEIHREISQAVRAGGSRYLVVVIPSRWRLHPERLPAITFDAARLALYERAVADLRALRAEVVEVTPLLERACREAPTRPLVHPADTHLAREGFEFVTTEALAPRLGTGAALARRRLASLPRRRHQDLGNLASNLGFHRDHWPASHYVLNSQTPSPPPTYDADHADLVILGNSYSHYYDHLFPRLIEAATALSVDARFTGG
ncbi:MAG: hypothetical protein KDB53_17990, partial [Planctomycetes bacterium]|nr:hypothetical protein [Planctomycetota bacterium]